MNKFVEPKTDITLTPATRIQKVLNGIFVILSLTSLSLFFIIGSGVNFMKETSNFLLIQDYWAHLSCLDL